MRKSSYWERRKHYLYYRAVYQIVSVVGKDARSILDVGSANAEYIRWFYWIERRVQLNLSFRGELEGVERITANFLEWEPQRFDVTLCLQVLEHVPEVERFCERLKETAPRLVISVPYKWTAGKHAGHIHDPVDEQKLLSWLKVKPNYRMCVTEPFGAKRMIAYYDLENGPEHKIPRDFVQAAIAERSMK